MESYHRRRARVTNRIAGDACRATTPTSSGVFAKMTQRVLTLVGLTVILLAAGCSRRRPPVVPPTTASPEVVNEERAPGDSPARAAAMRDSLERVRIARETARARLEAPIYFDFDRSDIMSAARVTLDAKLDILRASPSVRMQISGHADERGSDEYNLALGQRRAAAAKRYLVQYGVAEHRLEIISFGEERPVCTVSDESCWTRNRRGDFEITAGADAIAIR
jgi:peptidoglycan-associated lipoprotein